MIEIAPNLFIGAGVDEMKLRMATGTYPDDWHVVSAAKEPWHREALGYKERGAPKDHDEYLIALRPRHMILNLVDVADPAYIRDEIMDAAMKAIRGSISDCKVLVHCNQGQSRAPTIGMLYLRRFTDKFAGLSYADGVEAFKALYPPYAPAKGMAAYAEAHWEQK